MISNPVYRKSTKIIKCRFFTCYIYYMNPGGVEKKHFHDGIEIEYVIKGNSKTHKQGKLYVRKGSEVHEGINDSKNELVFVCVQIPPESPVNTHYLA